MTFLEFTQTFQKSYGSPEEYSKRREIFLQNYNDILRHNQLYEEGKLTWWRKITEHSDLTPEEFAATKNLGMPPVDPEMLTNTVDAAMEGRIQAGAAPEEWSWVQQGGVSSVKNQKACGSCAAFGEKNIFFFLNSKSQTQPPSPPSTPVCGPPQAAWRTTSPSST